VTRGYYAEGELVPRSPGTTYYYGVDQLGSVRRVFESTTNAPAYAYDPYGNPLQATAPPTDFGYAGLFHEIDSGLNLATYRSYDTASGRWLSRDPLDEPSDPAANLYRYTQDNPISLKDPSGLWTLQVGFSGALGWYVFGSASFGIIVDSSGNAGVYGALGYGAGSTPTAWGGVGAAGSTAQTICDIGGPFHGIGGSGGAGPGFSGDYFWGKSLHGPVKGAEIYAGPAVGGGVFSGTTYTWVRPLIVWPVQ
jgi:RHS repeat-associated protein